MSQPDSMPKSAGRPERISLPDFAGRLMTLGGGPGAWLNIRQTGKDLLLLGLGDGEVANLPFVRETLEGGGEIYWLEDEKTLGRLLALPHFRAPQGPHWSRITLAQAARLAATSRIFLYRGAKRLSPRFWGGALAKIELSLQDGPRGFAQKPAAVKTAWLPGSELRLLHRELRQALANMGFQVMETENPAQTPSLWQGRIPDFALSVNLRGLDSEGRIFHICQELNVPLAIWLVDNPWHILSAIQLPWWQEANIFVTDPGFIPALKQAGAKNVYFCPLATSSHMWRKPGRAMAQGAPLFVGTSAFAAKKAFFAGIRLDPALVDAANKLLEADVPRQDLPDYHWWSRQYGVHFWPGKEARKAGLGADNSSRENRLRWLKGAIGTGMEIMGDSGWLDELPNAGVLPPVDYYGKLPESYGNAACVLNVTSLLLPASLNQRHFDVWAAGGALLTDATTGLDIFPRELVDPIVLEHPLEFPQKLAFFKSRPGIARDLSAAWRECLRKEHSYVARLAQILKLSRPKDISPVPLENPFNWQKGGTNACRHGNPSGGNTAPGSGSGLAGR